MKFNSKLNKENLLLYYYENKEYAISLIAIGVSFLLFFIFILPQILSFPSRKQAIDVENEKLNRIKETERIVLAKDSNALESQLKLVSNVLPPAKSFEHVLNGISAAAALSGVQIENYQFQNQETLQGEDAKYLKLNFEITIIGDAINTVNFIKELYKTYPVSEVSDITTEIDSSTLMVAFYYKPFSSVGVEDRFELKSMSAEQKSILAEISNWNDPSVGGIVGFSQDASSSAEIKGSPF